MASVVGETFFGLDLAKIKSNFSTFRRRVSKRVLLIECGIASINLAEVKVQDGSIALDHIRRYPLPEEAMERGIPTDPAQMAALIRGHCLEEDIPAHRAAVVIPPDAAFTTLVKLPADLSPDEALAYALDPSSSLQVPIQLEQTDADLIPLDLPHTPSGQRSYFLTAVPRKLVDRLLETIKLADLELLRLQIGTFSQLSQLREVMSSLAFGQVILHLELLRECSMVTLLTSGGPIRLVRLTAIREFPEPEAGAADVDPNQLVSTERQIVASDRYLPLSELDVRRLGQELKQTIQESELQFPWIRWHSIKLAGPSSAHPLLAELLQESIKLPVDVCRPLAVGGVGTVELKQPILVQRLGRLVGLGLSFLDFSDELPRDQLSPGNAGQKPVLSMQTDHANTLSVSDVSSIDASGAGIEVPVEHGMVNLLADQFVDQGVSGDPESALDLRPEASLLEATTRDIQEANSLTDLISVDLEVLRPDPTTDSADKTTSFASEPLFNFSSDDPEFQAFERKILIQDDSEESLKPDAEISMPPALPEPNDQLESGTGDEEQSPFSMSDLLSSFEARQQSQPEQIPALSSSLPEVDQSDLQGAADSDQLHLIDDPTLWPSVAKSSVEGGDKN